MGLGRQHQEAVAAIAAVAATAVAALQLMTAPRPARATTAIVPVLFAPKINSSIFLLCSVPAI